MAYLTKWFFKLFVWALGVKFYQSKLTPSDMAIVRTVFKTVDNRQIEFRFYREKYVDTFYRFGFFRENHRTEIVIHALFDIDGEHPVLKFNNTRYNFKTNWLNGVGNDVITSVLLGVYIVYLHKNLKNN